MASHNRTPASVLDAPLPTVTYTHATLGPNREKRRHFRLPSNGSELGALMRFKPMIPNRGNDPYVKPTDG